MSPRTAAITVFTIIIALTSFSIGVLVGDVTPKPPQVDATEDLRSKLNEVIDRVNVIDSELYELQGKRP